MVKDPRKDTLSIVFVITDYPSAPGSSQLTGSRDFEGPVLHEVVQQLAKRNDAKKYAYLVAKGKILGGHLSSAVDCVRQSIWTSNQAFERYGWVEKRITTTVNPSDMLNKPIREFLPSLGISLSPVQNNYVHWAHERTVSKGGGSKEVYKATNGYYAHLFCWGAVIVRRTKGGN